MEKEESLLHQIDYRLIFIVFLLATVSVVAVYSATNSGDSPYFFVVRQFIWYLIGILAIMGSLFVDYRRLTELSIPLYGIGIALLLYVAFFGDVVNGAKGWIKFPGFSFQPAEVMKLFLIISIAQLLTKVQEKVDNPSFREDLILTGKIGLVFLPPFALIIQQPDLGTALVLVGIVAFMILIAGISWRIILLLFSLGVGFISFLVFLHFVNYELFSMLIKEHQLSRIYGWLDPQADATGVSYQFIQGLLAIGSGQLLGKGVGEGTQSQGGWIPEVHTDFIFALIAEETGFLGASFLISLYFILIYRLVHIALSCNDLFGTYLVGGITGMIVFQVFQNIGMAVGILPIAGLSLPFVSYGGSGILTYMIAIGIVLNVSMRTKNYMFD
jgi:rod shape determining protein RodA